MRVHGQCPGLMSSFPPDVKIDLVSSVHTVGATKEVVKLTTQNVVDDLKTCQSKSECSSNHTGPPTSLVNVVIFYSSSKQEKSKC